MHRAALVVPVLRDDSMIAIQHRDFFITMITALDFAVDRRGCPEQTVSDLIDRYLGLRPIGQIAPFVEVQMRLAASHSLTPCRSIPC